MHELEGCCCGILSLAWWRLGVVGSLALPFWALPVVWHGEVVRKGGGGVPIEERL